MYSQCQLNGTLEHDGHWYCKKHHRPSMDAYDQQRNEKWEAKWAEQDKQRKAANRQQALKDMAWEYVKIHLPELAEEWEVNL